MLKAGGRLVLVTPYIVTRSGQAVTMPIGEKLESLGFKRVQPFTKEMFKSELEGSNALTVSLLWLKLTNDTKSAEKSTSTKNKLP